MSLDVNCSREYIVVELYHLKLVLHAHFTTSYGAYFLGFTFSYA